MFVHLVIELEVHQNGQWLACGDLCPLKITRSEYRGH